MTGTGERQPRSERPADESTIDLTARLRSVLATAPATSAEYDLHGQLESVLAQVGMRPDDSGGTIEFTGADPVLPDVLRLAGGTSIALAAKSVAVAALWRMRGGAPQDISMDLRVAPHRLCPFFERKWELLDGHFLGNPAQVSDALAASRFYRTADGRFVNPIAPYPGLRNDACTLLQAPEEPTCVRNAISRWHSHDLEAAAEDAGVIMPVLRTTSELMQTLQYGSVLSRLPVVSVEKVGETEPIPFTDNAASPLDGVRVLGRGHIIAGGGCGRALALHGADVLNIWGPQEHEVPMLYMTSNVGVRSARLNLHDKDDHARMMRLLSEADVFYANRRPGSLARFGLDAEHAATVRPGIVHAEVSLNGATGPWAQRVGFDQTAGALAGVMLLEGDEEAPALPAVPVVNDYITAWFLELGVLRALMLRAAFGGSYKVSVSLTRVALWMISLGLIDKGYAADTAGRAPDHEYLDPALFHEDTPVGRYTGIQEQVRMSETPGRYPFALVPRGSQRPMWST